MLHIKKLTQYFKQSLIDAERLCPSDNDLLPVIGQEKKQSPSAGYLALDNNVWLNGQIDTALAKDIIASRQPKGKPELTEVELVLFPRVDILSFQGGGIDKRKRRVLLPLAIFVRLKNDGELKASNKAPWIPREWLGPSQSTDAPIGEVAELDKFLTQNPFEGIDTWQQLVAYSTNMLCAVIGVLQTETGNKTNQSGPSLFEVAVHSEYQLSNQCLLQTETMVVGAKDKILKVLDALVGEMKPPPLYKRFCSDKSPNLEPNLDIQFDTLLAKTHIGQMTGEFPLSPKQRNALHHLFRQKNGDILAVNGPPGTGKTTLLRSVVANLWAQAALDEKEPPLIIATSNNNQAVTNILESFAKVDEEGLDERLQGRWLPEVASYGLYCCASGKANERNPYMYYGPKGEGCMEGWQTREYINRAAPHFLDKVSHWHHSSITDIAKAKKELNLALKQTQQAIVLGIDQLVAVQRWDAEISSRYGSIASLLQEIVATDQRCSALEVEYSQAKSRVDKLFALWEARNFWIRLLLWLPVVRKQEQRKTIRLLNSWGLDMEAYDDDTVESCLITQARQHKEQLERTNKHLGELCKIKEGYEAAFASLTEWIEKYRPEKLFANGLPDQVNEINDRILRFKLFKLATHYWEARWLLELKEFFDNNDSDKKSPAKVLRKLRRFAKLTPCFVSTFYMVPATFMAGAFRDDTWMDIPLFNEIDLLIVDEAGQALPEVSAASFALAKRALVVGDTDQIEPVWSVPASVDRANLKLFGLLNDDRQYDAFWLQSGLLASSGSVMRAAQLQCRYHQFRELQRGLYLTEHRRCYDSIVNYCNALVYKGALEPLRGEPKTEVPWGTMSMIPVTGSSQSYGGSRGNIGEARKIAEWLAHEQEKIIQYAKNANPKWSNKDDSEVLKLAVGIVTPFSKQAALIRYELGKEGITGLTVGTVHSLQGDERGIVIFSSVYGENDRSTSKFYDSGPNMLNVAVSRAKDAFIVFGHPDVFGATNTGSPSGVLRSKLTQIGSKTVAPCLTNFVAENIP